MEDIFDYPEDRILRAVNRANPQLPFPLTPDEIVISDPQLHIGPDGSTNTKALLSPKDSSIVRYVGTVEIYYTRIFLPLLLGGLKIPGSPEDYSDSHDVITTLAKLYSLPIRPSDIGLLPTSDPNGLLITATASSIGYYGSIVLEYAPFLTTDLTSVSNEEARANLSLIGGELRSLGSLETTPIEEPAMGNVDLIDGSLDIVDRP